MRNMEGRLHEVILEKEELIRIIRNIPDTIIVYDRNKKRVICSKIVDESYERKQELLNSGDQQKIVQLNQSEREMDYAIDFVLSQKEPMSFIHMAPHYLYPTLFTLRPIFDEDGEVEFIVVNGRSQAVINKFSREYVKMEEELEKNQESMKLLNQLHLKSAPIVAESAAMRQILKMVRRIAQTDSTVIIVGESGTGKEVVATAIHENSLRKDGVFVPVNCSAIPPELMESEFFGYASGSFTGAKANGRVGLFEVADKGTLFLDEIGELPLSLQSKLLRALETGEIRPVGSNKSKKVDVRIIAATNRNLEEMVKAKEFREDLYYRLHIIPIKIPPLRDRKEDILPLTEYFLGVYNKKHNRNCYLTDSAKEELLSYDWPGNIRELRNLVERLIIISDVDAIFQLQIMAQKSSTQFSDMAEIAGASENYYDAVAQFEKAFIDRTLHLCDGDVSKAAEHMGVHRSMLYKKIKKIRESE